MKMLILDTSQKIGVLALYKEGFGFEKKEFESINQQKILIPMIDALLTESNLSLSDLTHIAICIGPGSFTGTRIGVMTAKTFSYALTIPLIPFNSLIPFHTPGTLTIKEAKEGLYFVYNGLTLEKTPLKDLDPTLLQVNINEAPYSFQTILSLPIEENFSILY
jgi:tRNA A37 threonylcarbamoyladenosine modification protein TsaB